MMLYQSALCPAPWRVPTREDFAKLDQAVGGAGTGVSYANVDFRDTYLRLFAPTYSGYAFASGAVTGVGAWGLYWANTPAVSATNGFVFSIRSGSGANASIFDQTNSQKGLGIAVRCVRDVVVGCAGGITEQQLLTGGVAWDNSRERTVGGITWGSYVNAGVCNKTSFNANAAGGVSTMFQADCRQAGSGQSGALFSLCMIERFGHLLCPPPTWRLPTPEDFILTDRALGGTGLNGQTNTALAKSYTDNCGNGRCWAGTFTGYVFNGVLYNATTMGHYWAIDANKGITQLTFGTQYVNPTAPAVPTAGYALRCIKR
jgi:hypothetical protein